MVFRQSQLKALAILVAAFLFAFVSAQNRMEVLLVTPSGIAVPFSLFEFSSGSIQTFNACYHGVYESHRACSPGFFAADVGGTSTTVPINLLARADLVSPGSETVWRFTLKDGRVFDGFVENIGAYFVVRGQNEFGVGQTLYSLPKDPRRQAFIGVIFDPAATAPGQATTPGGQAAVRADADNVNLRNGDILSGTILTTEFTVQASYGTLTFTKDQLHSVTVENVAGKTDQVLLKVGDRVSGVLQNASIQMILTSGATITLEKGNIASITFARQE